ncbi:MAG: D-alanyl-D-alanine carboxypeptidase family protein [Porticoccaceae bacterium]|jgi:D-alanyl-D-alanine carboxypeptidase (penicillin-binding protein 5/6)|nr:D-alanyl-D-alanine carboxypeptidase family protein [Porticoccaceae bacterium]HLS98654.1 D-alanyl-D-alanine carboxypeptidase family protein [Porticoccaceae bacterium]
MLKKLTQTGLVLFSLALALAARAELLIPAPPEIAAKAWILMDADTGKVLVEHNADERLPPASLTKMMTSYVVSREIHDGRLKEDDVALVSEYAWRTGGWASGSSVMSLLPKSQAKVIDLMRGVIIQSGNDASIVLAEHIAGSETAFADIMNQVAEQLGLKNTHFMNSTGLPDPDHYSSARDMALLGQALIRDYPEHYAIYSEKYFEYDNHRQANRNRLLWRDGSVDGIKTGHTQEAGYCLVASAVRDGMRLIAVVMGTSGEETRAREAQTLLAYGFRYYETTRILTAGQVLSEGNRVWYGEADYLNLAAPEDVHATIPRGSKESLTTEIELEPVLKAPIEKGQQLGTARVKFEDKLLKEIPLVAAEAVPEAGLFSRLWDAIMLFFINLFA